MSAHVRWTLPAFSVVLLASFIATTVRGQVRQPASESDAKQPRLMLQLGHPDGANSVAFSPDGKLVLTCGGGDRVARLWDAASGKEIRRLEGHSFAVDLVAFASDGKHVLTGGGDGTARLWDTASGKETRKLNVGQGSLYSLAFSPDSKQILTVRFGVAEIWDADTGTSIHKFEVATDAMPSAEFAPDGKTVLICADSGVRLCKMPTAVAKSARSRVPIATMLSAEFSPDGKKVLITLPTTACGFGMRRERSRNPQSRGLEAKRPRDGLFSGRQTVVGCPRRKDCTILGHGQRQ